MTGREESAGSPEGGSPEGRSPDTPPAGTRPPDGSRPAPESGGQGRPGEILAELTGIRRKARTARHAYWFPLVVFGVLIAASAPFFVQQIPPPSGIAVAVPSVPLAAFGGLFVSPWLSYYWLAAIVAGLALTGLWYRRHGARVGLRTPSRGFLLTGLAITAVLLTVSLAAGNGPLADPLTGLVPGVLTMRGTLPLLIIAAALWVLARAERSAGLAVVAGLFTGSALLADLYNVENIAFRLGWQPTGVQWRYTALPGVLLPAVVLLAGGAIAFAAQRRRRAAAA
ncbi:MAG: hypothetical protein M0030_17550 [Actinomycetota bacterium]|nr:hypothetical protein [Actinomycetota bacterium]